MSWVYFLGKINQLKKIILTYLSYESTNNKLMHFLSPSTFVFQVVFMLVATSVFL